MGNIIGISSAVAAAVYHTKGILRLLHRHGISPVLLVGTSGFEVSVLGIVSACATFELVALNGGP